MNHTTLGMKRNIWGLTLKIPFQSWSESLSMDQWLQVGILGTLGMTLGWLWDDLVWDAPGPRNEEFMPQLMFIPKKISGATIPCSALRKSPG